MKKGKPKVLIVDDELLNRELLEAILHEQYEVITACNGQEALSKVSSECPDIVLLDIIMSDINGYEVCRQLKKNKETSIIPVVMITVLKEKDERIKAIEVGADDFLSKPVDPTEVLTRVKSLLRVKSLYDELTEINKTLRQRIAEQVEELYQTIAEKERLAKLAVMGRLTAGVAHEIRNPLGGIRLLAEGLRAQLAEDDPNRKYVDKILVGEAKLSQFVHNFLIFARPFELKLVPISINQIIDDSLTVLVNKIEKANVKILKNIPETLPKILIDPDRMCQVASNLIVNALEAMKNGGELRISAELIDEQSMMELRFEDTGCGIEQKEISNLFTPFYSTKGTGTGLGLAIVHNIIELHHGWIEVESKLRQGTIFRICLKFTP